MKGFLYYHKLISRFCIYLSKVLNEDFRLIPSIKMSDAKILLKFRHKNWSTKKKK